MSCRTIASVLLVSFAASQFCGGAAAEDLTDAEWQLVREQVDRMEAAVAGTEAAHYWFWEMRHLQLLVAMGEVDRAWQLVDSLDDSRRRKNLRILARDCVEAGRAEQALEFFRAVDDLTWYDYESVANVAPDGFDLQPFEACLPHPLTAEERWLMSNWDPSDWLAAYEEGKQIATFVEWGSEMRMDRLYAYATTFPEYAEDERTWTHEADHGVDFATTSKLLFMAEQYDKGFEILQRASGTQRHSELSMLEYRLTEYGSTDFPDRATLAGYLRDDETYELDGLLVAAPLGNRDWDAAINEALDCEDEGRRGFFLSKVMQASLEAGDVVPELLEYESLILDRFARERHHAAFLLLEVKAGIRDNVSQRLTTIEELPDDDLFGFGDAHFHDDLRAFPALAEVALETDHERILAWMRPITEEMFRALHGHTHVQITYDFAKASLILGEDADFRRAFHYRSEFVTREIARWNGACRALVEHLDKIPELADRLAQLDRLDLGPTDAVVRQITVYEFLTDHDVITFQEMFEAGLP